MADETASCKYCGGNLPIIKYTDSSQSLRSMTNFKCSDNLCESSTLPGHYVALKNESHLEINRRLILVMRAIGKGHSGAEKFLHLMNHRLYAIVIRDCTQKNYKQ